ncbi:unnamed protein product [Urochloa decumbens]|uniref:NAC domain-containing protein n=1 Tax=Urochloa decumbens TaxID=240449 RepID=A0ABC8X0Z1_9POAL
MNWSYDQQPYESSGSCTRRKAKNGYWEFVDSSRISTSTTIVGVKIILEFHEGQAPGGIRTRWVMHEYQVERNDEANLPQDYKSLCTVFLKGDKKISAEGQHNSTNADSPKDTFGAYLQYLAKIEEPKQTVDANEQGISSSNGQDEQNTGPVYDIDVMSTEDYIELNDLLYGDTAVRDDALTLEDLTSHVSASTSTNSSKRSFAVHDALTLEDVNDLLTPEASASTSANSSKRSMLSEEYFDLDAFLREDLKESNTTDGQNKDQKFSIAAPAKLANVVMNPLERELVKIHDINSTVARTSQKEPLPGGDRDQQSSSGFQQKSPSISSCFPGHSDSSQSSIKSPGERSSSKFGKIIKKYSCFRSL